jgi:hypothetical protein
MFHLVLIMMNARKSIRAMFEQGISFGPEAIISQKGSKACHLGDTRAAAAIADQQLPVGRPSSQCGQPLT